MRGSNFAFAVTLALATVATAQTPEQKPAKPAKDSPDRMICKRFVKTGSLVDAERICKTKAQWDHDRANLYQPPVTAGSCNSTGAGYC